MKKLLYVEIVESVKSLIDSTPENEKHEFSGTGGLNAPIEGLPFSYFPGNNEYLVGKVYGYGYGDKDCIGIVYHGNLYKYAIDLNDTNIQKVLSSVTPILNNYKTWLMDYDSFKEAVTINGKSFSSVLIRFEKLMKMNIENIIEAVNNPLPVKGMRLPLYEEELIHLLYGYYSKFIPFNKIDQNDRTKNKIIC
jgi:hypothetical protein